MKTFNLIEAINLNKSVNQISIKWKCQISYAIMK